MTKFLSKIWRAISGKKVWIALGGFTLEALVHFYDHPELIALLPADKQALVNGALAMLFALGILHRADKSEIAKDK